MPAPHGCPERTACLDRPILLPRHRISPGIYPHGAGHGDRLHARIFAWLEGWYNPHRRHSSLGYRSTRELEGTHERNLSVIREMSAK